MTLNVNLRHLENEDLHIAGQVPLDELDLVAVDEVISLNQPLDYDLEIQKLEEGILVRGRLSLPLDCQCVRCLKEFSFPLGLEDWSCLLPFEGEEAVVVSNDCVDLTPYVREDILLAFPQHPLCDPECRGLPSASAGKTGNASGKGKTDDGSSAWAELNKLKFNV